jgi:hypothetical protein
MALHYFVAFLAAMGAAVVIAVALSKINHLDDDAPEIVDMPPEPLIDQVDVRAVVSIYKDDHHA